MSRHVIFILRRLTNLLENNMSLHDTRYRKITTELENRIRAGVYAPGAALPPRVELMAEFSVARATIDRCIGELRRRNLVVSRHGSGTFVKDELHHPYRVMVIARGDIQYRLPDAWEVKVMPASSLTHKSEWPAMLDYDGVIWFQPGREMRNAIDFLHGHVPQVIINRILPGEVCVSTDHRGAYYEITRERLDHLPAGQVYLLQTNEVSDPTAYREAGFIDACRAAQRFYEILTMPDEFDAKLARLEQLPAEAGKPLLLISTSMANTGAVMWFARTRNLKWGKDIFYSDFDNDLPSHCWGVKVTSFIQNNSALFAGAVSELENLLEGKFGGERHTLIEPKRCQGDT